MSVNTGLVVINILDTPWVNSLAISPTSDGSRTNLFAGTQGGGVYLSANNGKSWTAVDSGLTNTYL
jgi:hypothetical protein